MTLSDLEIRAEIGAERLIFDPPITDTTRIGSSSVDLLLHDELLILPNDRVPGISIDPSDDGFDVMQILTTHGKAETITTNSPYIMAPNHLIIAKTLETITLPRHLSARIEGRSSLARLGLSVQVTAPTVMAGFQGRLFLEMNNIGPFLIQLKPSMTIAQLILEHVGLPALEPYQGQFQRQI
jgi:dCTP deaminase